MLKRIDIIIFIFLIILISCDSNNLDLDGNWIKIEYLENSASGEGIEIDSDTLFATINEAFTLRIWTQTQPNFELKVLIKNNENRFVDITNESIVRGHYEENEVQRRIVDFDLSFNENLFDLGEIVSYVFRIESSSEMIEKPLTIKIK